MSEEVKEVKNEVETVEAEVTAEDMIEEKKPSIFARAKNWCKNHKVAATVIGVATGGALVVGGAMAAKAAIEHFFPEPETEEEDDPTEENYEDKTKTEE